MSLWSCRVMRKPPVADKFCSGRWIGRALGFCQMPRVSYLRRQGRPRLPHCELRPVMRRARRWSRPASCEVSRIALDVRLPLSEANSSGRSISMSASAFSLALNRRPPGPTGGRQVISRAKRRHRGTPLVRRARWTHPANCYNCHHHQGLERPSGLALVVNAWLPQAIRTLRHDPILGRTAKREERSWQVRKTVQYDRRIQTSL